MKKFKIAYTSHDFPHGTVSRSGDLETTWDDVIWAALTIGRPNTAHVFKHGSASLYEAIFRISQVKMAIEQHSLSERFYQTDAFRALDPTEKGSVSYFLGMAACKLFASELLNTPWLLHLDVFRNQFNAVTLGRSRPDLIGEDSKGSWHAFESKGRSGTPSLEDKRKAKEQSQRVVSVNGRLCTLHIGSVAFFRQEQLQYYWRDPEPNDPEPQSPLKIELRADDWAYYYGPVLALSSEPDKRLADLFDLSIAIHPSVRPFLLNREWSTARALSKDMREELDRDGFQPDGIRVVAGNSWNITPS